MAAELRAVLERVRLTSFKSFQDEELPLFDLTVLTGRNSAGKSNALDAIEVLSRIVGGEDLADALDGRRREGGPVRGGSAGCAPHGEDRFTLGCTVSLGGGDRFDYDVTIQVEPELRIISESLYGFCPAIVSGQSQWGPLLLAKSSGPRAPSISGGGVQRQEGKEPVLIRSVTPGC